MCACQNGRRCPRCVRDDAAWGILPGDWPDEPKTLEEEMYGRAHELTSLETLRGLDRS